MKPTPLEALLAFDPDDPFVQRSYRAGLMFSRFFDTHIKDVERIPAAGGVMIVGNHSLMGVDSWALIPELAMQTQRIPRGMGLRSLFDVPMLGKTLKDLGMVSGDRASAITLLEQGELVLTYPGGARDSLKGVDQRYKLQWDGREGFAHAAILGGAPVVPIVGVGPDDCFPKMGRRGLLPTRGLGARVKLPLFLPILRRIPFDFHVGLAMAPPELSGEEQQDRALLSEAVSDFASDVRHRTQELLDTAALWRDRVGSSRSMR